MVLHILLIISNIQYVYIYIYKVTDFSNRVLNRALYIDYIALAIDTIPYSLPPIAYCLMPLPMRFMQDAHEAQFHVP